MLALTLALAFMIARSVRLPQAVVFVVGGMVLGPYGLGLIVPDAIALHALGEVGLLYAMFVAGLELDRRQLMRHKRAAALFAVASFAIPFALGLVGARLLGYALMASLVIGSGWGSHTMVTLPSLRDLGLAHHRAVATVVGATPVTGVLTLAVLAGVSLAARHHTDVMADAAVAAIGLALLVAWTLLALPRLSRWFFARTETNQQFVFALGACLLGSVIAEATGVHGLVGAFLVGLGMARSMPEGSPVMERTLFVGRSLFVPVFLVSIGTLLDPSALLHARTLLYALVFTVIVLGGKLLAAALIGRHSAFDRREVAVMAGLSSSQVAPTLAAAAVGARLGLIDAFTFHVLLAVMLATLIVTPAVVTVFGKKLVRTSP